MRRSKAEPVIELHENGAAPAVSAKGPAHLKEVAAPSLEDASLQDLSRHFVEVIPRSMWSIRYGMREAAGQDLTVPQFRCLAMLSRKSRTNGELAERMGVSVPAMSRMVDGLVGLGLLIRVPQATDRRQIKLELSLDGRRKFQRMRRHTHGLFVSKFSVLEEGKRRRLREGLAVLGELFP